MEFKNAKDQLSFYAMLGSIHSERMKELGVDTKQIFDDAFNTAKAKYPDDPIKALQETSSIYQIAMIKTMPLFNRCNFILNKLDAAKNDSEEFDESSIKWDLINDILFKDPLDYDYNLVSKVSSIDEIRKLHSVVCESQILGGPWYRQTCKTCKETFTLTFNELQFYERKGLNIPKRCKNCIDESKGKESYRQAKAREDKERAARQKQLLPTDNRTAMEIAFEKAKKKVN